MNYPVDIVKVFVTILIVTHLQYISPPQSLSRESFGDERGQDSVLNPPVKHLPCYSSGGFASWELLSLGCLPEAR